MSIVAFEHLPQKSPGDTLAGGSTPVMEFYHPVWGFFIFGQSVDFVYEGTRTYRETPVFTISGTFTINAEEGVKDSSTLPPDKDDTYRFNKLMAKFTALEAMLDAATKAAEPANFMNWAGPLDPRCVPLPDPLRDKNHNQIWATPKSIDITPGSWTEAISYRVVLAEAKLAPYKLKVNQTILDDGVLNITLPAPIMSRHRLIACAGEVLQCKNYSVLECEISGSTPRKDTDPDMVGAAAKTLASSLQTGYADIKVLRRNQTTLAQQEVTVFPAMDVARGTGIEVQVEGLKTGFSIQTKARI